MIQPLSLKMVKAARSRISGHVRRTPLLQAIALKQPIPGCDHLWLKLDCLQVTGSFKARGAVNKLLSLSPEKLERGIVTASGGNHGLAVAYAGWMANVPATIYLPHNTPPAKADKLRQWGATVIMEGAVWDDANRAALRQAEQENLAYIHPFADPFVMAGQGTLALEILEDLPEVDTLVVAIGGGGLISGISFAAKALRPYLSVIGVEAVGAPTLHDSLKAGKIIELASVNTKANTLAPRQTEAVNFDIIQNCVNDVVLVTDEQMQTAARWLWFECGIAAELSGAAAIAALQSGLYQPADNETVCALICGSGTDGV
ncbi:threonine/serine dehydratase [Oscillatoria sp. CS-180]|uniref:threonine ammonia-lyase n=1 Tax=Oscillatoria sp. CS-180 TaxID=3021720 RepID=UPI0023302558|nr:threonine/serine dehydratase [Oscillatoria sp. CS-180]MDB9528408.1 threonine/serine dehydratase [Oscillatoria sp. CS-180]